MLLLLADHLMNLILAGQIASKKVSNVWFEFSNIRLTSVSKFQVTTFAEFSDLDLC